VVPEEQKIKPKELEAIKVGISRISRYGEVEINFSSPMQIPSDFSNFFADDVLSLSLERDGKSLQKMIRSWEVTSFEGQTLSLQIVF